MTQTYGCLSLCEGFRASKRKTNSSRTMEADSTVPEVKTEQVVMPPVEEILDLLPRHTSLYYVDYRDDLSGSLDKVQACITNQDWEALDDIVFDWDNWECYNEYLNQLRHDIQRNYDVDGDVADEWMEEYDDWIRDAIYERDDSTPIDDLLRNTGDEDVFYDTGYYVESESWSWDEKRMREELRDIKKHLGLKGKEHDADINMMIRQASYGGRLVIYFESDMKELICIDSKFNAIEFRDFTLAIIDNSNGSGDHCHLKGARTVLPLDPTNFFIDRCISYSYVHEVCGMCKGWCNGTAFSFLTLKKVKGELKPSTINNHIKREAMLDKVFKAGGCTFGDMKYTRHRNKEYRNDFPCGTKCLSCGTFWID